MPDILSTSLCKSGKGFHPPSFPRFSQSSQHTANPTLLPWCISAWASAHSTLNLLGLELLTVGCLPQSDCFSSHLGEALAVLSVSSGEAAAWGSGLASCLFLCFPLKSNCRAHAEKDSHCVWSESPVELVSTDEEGRMKQWLGACALLRPGQPLSFGE